LIAGVLGGSRRCPTPGGRARSADSFRLSRRCGARPNARQIRETAVWLRPAWAAIDRVDRVHGVDSRVAVITRSTSWSGIVRGRSGRGSSSRSSSRSTAKRLRHLVTLVVGRDQPYMEPAGEDPDDGTIHLPTEGVVTTRGPEAPRASQLCPASAPTGRDRARPLRTSRPADRAARGARPPLGRGRRSRRRLRTSTGSPQ